MADETVEAEAPHQLITFLRQQSQGSLTRLYNRPSSCLAVFRFGVMSCLEYSLWLKTEFKDFWVLWNVKSS